MNEVTGFSLLFAAVGLLFIGLSVPLMLGKVPPNYLYGCRTKETLSEPRVWYEANRVSGKDFALSGVLILVASLVMVVFGQGADPDHVVITLLSVLLLCVAVAAWRCLTIGRRV